MIFSSTLGVVLLLLSLILRLIGLGGSSFSMGRELPTQDS